MSQLVLKGSRPLCCVVFAAPPRFFDRFPALRERNNGVHGCRSSARTSPAVGVFTQALCGPSHRMKVCI